MKALSIRQPWAWAIIYGNKNIENRSWTTHWRGEILIHAAKNCTKKEYRQAASFCKSMGLQVPELELLPRGQIIGVVTISDCVYSKTASGWGMPEQYHWHLKNPQAIAPVSCLGQPGLFDVVSDKLIAT